MTDSIPAEGAPKIANASEDSKDTQTTIDETIENKTDQISKDSIDSTELIDTPKKDDELERAKAEYSNLARVQYETLKTEVSKDPDKILSVYEADPKTANKICKSLWGDKGFNKVEDLIMAVKKNEEYRQIEDPDLRKRTMQDDQREQKLLSMLEDQGSKLAKIEEEKALDKLYKKYPTLHPDNDSNDESWKKFKSEFDLLNPSISLDDRFSKAYKLAFGDEDTVSTKEFEKTFGSLSSGGSAPIKDKRLKISKESYKVSEVSGVEPETVERYSNYFNK